MPKPAIFIPGFPASELHDVDSGMTLFPPPLPVLLNTAKRTALLDELVGVSGKVVAGLPIASILGGVVQEAQTIYNILQNQFGYDISPASRDFIPIGWDWRESIDSDATVQKLTDALDTLSPAKNGNVVAILHSTGGLVFRAFLEKKPDYAQCFEQVLSFGIPWAGTLEALHAVAEGVSIAFLFIKLLSRAEGTRLMSHAQAAYDLFPTDPTLNLFFGANGQSTTPVADQSWIAEQYERDLANNAHGPFPRTFDTLPVTNVCGWGAPTWTTASIQNNQVVFAATSKEAGDGTVPFVSSSWLQGAKVRSMFLPIGAYATGFLPKIHGQIWDSPPVLQLFNEVFADKARQPFLCAAADSDQQIDVNSDVTVRISAMDGDGNPLPNCTAVANLDGKRSAALDLSGKKGTIVVRRQGIQHNIGSDIYRFMIEFKWDGGSDKRAVLIHSV